MKNPPPLDRRRAWAGYLGVLAVLALFGMSPWARQLDNLWLDAGFRALRQHAPLPDDGRVVVVGIDDEDLREFGTPLAILHREIGDFLQAMAGARPAAVGLDVVLPATSYDRLQPGLDAALARGILAARGSTFLVLGLTADAAGQPRPLHPPFLRLAGPEGTGFVFLPRDEDIVIRRFDERLGRGGETVPTLIGRIARRLGHESRPGIMHYALGEPFSYIPLRRVLAWHRQNDVTVLQTTFGNRVVLLGSVLQYDDQHATPVALAAGETGADTSHGVLIHAQQMRTVLASATVAEWPGWLALLLVPLVAGSWWLNPGTRTWGGAGLLALAASAGSLAAQRAGLALPLPLVLIAGFAGLGARTGVTAFLAARERRRLRASFDGLVSPVVLEEMLSGRLTPDIEGQRRDICVLFSDIRSFTTLSESMAPEDVTALLNDYFARMTRVIHAHGGTLDKFIGDGIMAFFGAPRAADNTCADAFAAARAMLAELDDLNRERAAAGQPALAIGIGLHYGPAVIGYIGSRERNEYSAIGDTVNAASRIEGLTKDAGFPLLLSASVVEQLEHRDGLVFVGPMAVKGRAPIEVHGWRSAAEKA